MTEMEERVARAIDPEIWADDLPIPTRSGTIEFHERRQASCAKARAAIMEMREPTMQMQNAGWREIAKQGFETDDVETAQIFSAMIDAALGSRAGTDGGRS